MATADEYAQWIVANADKRGTPEFETVAKAYQMAKAPKASEPPENPRSLKNLAGAAVEPGLSLLTGMVAQPVAGIAGLVAGATGGDAADTVRRASERLTYAPKTIGGQNAAKVIGAPFEMLSDAANAAGEKTTDLTGSPGLGAAVNTVINVAPAAIGAKGPSALSSAAGGSSRFFMNSALKPDKAAQRSGDAARAVQTLLDEGVNVTGGGAAKLGDKIDSINERIVDAIANSNATVSKSKVAGNLHDNMTRAEKQANPKADSKAVADAWTEFLSHPLLPTDQIPVQLAQEMKQGTYRQIGNKNYGELGGASIEAQKTLARGLKEGVAEAVPEVAPLNAKESALINAKDLVDARVSATANANPLGLAPIGGSIQSIVAMLLDRNNAVKSLLARGLNPGKRSVSDQALIAATAPQTFGDDMQARQRIIEALMGAR